jgi:beta-lactamase class A
LTILGLSLSVVCTVSAAGNDWEPLDDRIDSGFQAALEKRLRQNSTWARLIRNKKLAVGVVDLRTDPPRYARVNGDVMMYAASLPKIAVLLSTYVAFEDGRLKETQQIHDDLGAMIRVSSNSAATRLIDLVGMRRIQATLKDPRFGFYDEKHGGGLWVGKRYASDGPRQGDPLFNISHGATVTQVCRFFYLLASRRLISEERSEQMLADLAEPNLHHKFVSQLDKRAPSARVFRKSGTWRKWHSDAILVKGTRWRDYILVALVENENGESIIRQVLPAVEELLVPDEYVGNMNEDVPQRIARRSRASASDDRSPD